MEGNDYLCRSWFKLLIKGGSFPSIIAEAVFAKGRLFLRFLSFLLKSFKKHKFPAIFLQKSFVLQFSFVFLQKVL